MLISQDNGFQEAVGLVADADATATRLCAVLGYTVRHAGLVPAGALALMGLPAEAKAREVLIAQPNADRGNIRLVSLAGDTSGIMRDGAQAWDAGGIFDINIRALAGIEPLHHALGRAVHQEVHLCGWRARACACLDCGLRSRGWVCGCACVYA